MFDARAIRRFLKYTMVGGSTLCLDLALLFLFVDVVDVSPVWAAGIAFLVAVSVNYVISRHFVFRGTLRGARSGYVGFVAIALCGLAFVTVSMYFLYTYIMRRIFLRVLPSRL